MGLGLGLGLGLGIPLVAIFVGICLCLHRRKNSRRRQSQVWRADALRPPAETDMPMALSTGNVLVSPIAGKPVPLHPTHITPPPTETHETEPELTGEGVRRELRGTEVRPLRPTPDGNVLLAAPGRHEINAQSKPSELAGPGWTRSPPPAYNQPDGPTDREGYGQNGAWWELA